MGREMKRYDIMKDWSAGYVAALLPLAIDSEKSDHWHAGYTSGYHARKHRGESLDKYLVSIGLEPQVIISIADSDPKGASQ